MRSEVGTVIGRLAGNNERCSFQVTPLCFDVKSLTHHSLGGAFHYGTAVVVLHTAIDSEISIVDLTNVVTTGILYTSTPSSSV